MNSYMQIKPDWRDLARHLRTYEGMHVHIYFNKCEPMLIFDLSKRIGNYIDRNLTSLKENELTNLLMVIHQLQRIWSETEMEYNSSLTVFRSVFGENPFTEKGWKADVISRHGNFALRLIKIEQLLQNRLKKIV